MGRGKCACKAGFQLATVVTDAQSGGATPAQTMSRVLQELRDEGVVIFDGRGRYRLAEPSAAEPNSQSASIDADCRPKIAARELARVSRAVYGDCGGVCGGGAGALMRARVGLRAPPSLTLPPPRPSPAPLPNPPPGGGRGQGSGGLSPSGRMVISWMQGFPSIGSLARVAFSRWRERGGGLAMRPQQRSPA